MNSDTSSAIEIAECPQCRGAGWVVIDGQPAAKRWDGSEIDGHRRAAQVCPHVLTARRTRRILHEYGGEYHAQASVADLTAVPIRGGLALDRRVAAFEADWPRVGMMLIGGVGTGKSYAASAIVNRLFDLNAMAQLNCKVVTFAHVAAMLREARAVMTGPREGTFLATLHDADLVVLDDIGAEKPTEWTEGFLYELVAARYGRKRPMIVTSNYSLKDLKSRLGLRTLDRLIGGCDSRPIELQGESRRWAAR